MIGVKTNTKVIYETRTQKEGFILIEATAVNPVGDGYLVSITDHALVEEVVPEIIIVNPPIEEPEPEDPIELPVVYPPVDDPYDTTLEIPKDENQIIETQERIIINDIVLSSKNVFIPSETINYLYDSVPSSYLEGLNYSEKDKVVKKIALLSYIQTDLLDNGKTIYGLLPENWVTV